ncbi:MAG: succinate dehydrogenase [Acidimicrobiaceae bacterium]|nr:succinate dehydrogenase [Acidimicrobiaceae bacterium]
MSNTADLLVVGAGPGGMATALEASRNDASVILFEVDEVIGGNASRSTGYLAFQDFDMQSDEDLTDSPEIFFDDMIAEIERQKEKYGIIFDEDLAKIFAKESSETYSWLCELGFEFNRFLPRPLQHSVNRMVDVKDTTMFTTLFETALEESGVRILTSTRVERLIMENSQIIGIATSKGEFYANKGVVLAAGGYQANKALRQRYQPESMASSPYLGTEHDIGDGHLMGQEVGGDLINMTMIPPLIMVGSALVEESIAVNRDGERFHDEAGPYDYRVNELKKQPDQQAWYIFDNQTFKRKSQLIHEMPEEPHKAESLNGLAEEVGIDPIHLKKTVNTWNEFLTTDVLNDPLFGRVIFPNPRIGITESPFFASKMVIGINFPAGGFRVNTDLQVLNVYGEPISHLFAVGDCVGGLGPVIGMGGMRITPALTLGRVVGRNIATDQVSQKQTLENADRIPANKMKIPVVDA